MGHSSRGIETWTDHTTAFDRVWSIVEALDQPRTAQYIADAAAVSETTVHSHLKQLADERLLRMRPGMNPIHSTLASERFAGSSRITITITRNCSN